MESCIRAQITKDSLGGKYPAGSQVICYRVFKKHWHTIRGAALFLLKSGKRVIFRIDSAYDGIFRYEVITDLGNSQKTTYQNLSQAAVERVWVVSYFCLKPVEGDTRFAPKGEFADDFNFKQLI